MAGNEQRPTDDVEGHMPLRRAQDTEAVDEDQVGDDAEGHLRLREDTKSVDEDQAGVDDAEGHGIGRNG